jgi:hypothetical protein
MAATSVCTTIYRTFETIAEQTACASFLSLLASNHLPNELPTVGDVPNRPLPACLFTRPWGKYGTGEKRMNEALFTTTASVIILPSPFQASGDKKSAPLFKGCIAPNEISHIRPSGKEKTCYLLAGFMDDFLFYYKAKSCPKYPELISKIIGAKHRIECKQSSLSFGELRTHPLFL